MVRQKEIVQKTGFSLSVVSRALSPVKGKNDTLSEETREIVRRVAGEMGYKPNLQASCLRKGKLPTIGVFLPSWGGSLVYELIMGISDAAKNCEVPLSFYFDMSLDSYGKFLESMKDQGNSGILSYLLRFDDNTDDKIIKKLHSYTNGGGNIVFLNTFCYKEHGFPHVSIDEEEGGRLAAQYLRKQNCSKYIVVYYKTKLYQARCHGFVSELLEDAVPDRYEILVPSRDEDTCFTHALNEILESLQRETSIGIFTSSNMFFRHIITGGLAKRVLPKNDFRIVTYDRSEREPELYEPARIIQPFYEVGFKGFMKLYNLIGGKKEESERLKPSINAGANTI